MTHGMLKVGGNVVLSPQSVVVDDDVVIVVVGMVGILWELLVLWLH